MLTVLLCASGEEESQIGVSIKLPAYFMSSLFANELSFHRKDNILFTFFQTSDADRVPQVKQMI